MTRGASILFVVFAATWPALTAACAPLPARDTPAASVPSPPALVPMPAKLVPGSGHYVPGAAPRIALSDPASGELRELGALAAEILGQAWGPGVAMADAATPDAAVRLELAPEADANPESYRLRVDASGIVLRAPTAAGLFYGLQTLRQLAPPESGKSGIAAVSIEDAPRFGYRGLHLDVGRHLFPMDFLKRHLELMARYKFNTFHWHLTEDQGWRLEIKRYPKLTSVGAWRKETVVGNFDPDNYVGDGQRYGGYYTQAQARELIAYAKKLHITVIPEIELPGHTVAAMAAYPELACTPGPFEVRTTWGVDENVVCPSEETFAFFKNVLDEVMDVFPSEYIHVGGDEAPTVRWEASPLVQQIKRREGLADEHAVQGWFLRRIEQFVNARGRKIIGWDEVLDGDPSKTATIMSWRGMDGGIAAAKAGHDVIMSPTDFAYLDYCPSRSPTEPICIGGDLPLAKVYSFDPVPPDFTHAQAAHVLGGQGNLWTEYMKTPEKVEYMAWPRALALSEVLWSPQAARDWDGFRQRLPAQLAALDRLDVHYRIPEPAGLEADVVRDTERATLKLASLLPGTTLRYTTDGSEPGPASTAYTRPVELALGDTPTVVSARAYTAQGRAGAVANASFQRGRLQPALPVAIGTLRPGLQRSVRIGGPDAAPAQADVVPYIAPPENPPAGAYVQRQAGYLTVPVDGLYRFALTHGGAVTLTLDDQVLPLDDAPARSGRASVATVALAAGTHAFALEAHQEGEAPLRLRISRGDHRPYEVPGSWWRHRGSGDPPAGE